MPVEMLDRVLSVIADDLQRVCRYCLDATPGDYVNALRSGECHLHVAFKGDEYLGFAISQIAPLENGPVAKIKALGGDGVLEAIDLYEAEFRRIGCRAVEWASTRKGWMRKATGYEPAYTTYRKVL